MRRARHIVSSAQSRMRYAGADDSLDGSWQISAKALAKMKEAGIQVVTIADKKPFQDAVKPVWDKYAPQFSETIKRIQAVR